MDPWRTQPFLCFACQSTLLFTINLSKLLFESLLNLNSQLKVKLWTVCLDQRVDFVLRRDPPQGTHSFTSPHYMTSQRIENKGHSLGEFNKP